MTWRRRLIIATVALGGGIAYFQPLMRVRMESRLSEIAGGKVEIGSSKISIRDGTIALSDIVVRPFPASQLGQIETSTTPLKIQHAALKFNWKSLLYRNLTLENVVATEVRWELVEPTSNDVPTATAMAAPIPSFPNDKLAKLELDIAPIVQPIKLRMADVAAKQSTDHENVSTKIKSILERLAEVTSSQEAMNVLRQKPARVLEDAEKELAILHQLIAEDRIARRESDKALNSLRQTTQTSLVGSLEIDPAVISSVANQTATQLAKQAVAKEWNRNRPMIYAALNSLSSLQTATDPIAADTALNKSPTRTAGSELLSKLPVGLTRCVAGKAIGIAQFPGMPNNSSESTSEFELRFRNLCSADLGGTENPVVTIKMTRDAQQGGVPWLYCNAQHIGVPQSDSKQVHFVIERNPNGTDKRVTTIQHANQGWAASVSLPMEVCFEESGNTAGFDLAQLGGQLSGNSMLVAKIIGTTHSALAESNEVLIDIDAAGISAVEAILNRTFSSEAEKRKSQGSIRGTEMLNSELHQIASRWEQLGEEHARAHSNWEASIQEVNDQLRKLKSAFARTTRNTGVPAR